MSRRIMFYSVFKSNNFAEGNLILGHNIFFLFNMGNW